MQMGKVSSERLSDKVTQLMPGESQTWTQICSALSHALNLLAAQETVVLAVTSLCPGHCRPPESPFLLSVPPKASLSHHFKEKPTPPE